VPLFAFGRRPVGELAKCQGERRNRDSLVDQDPRRGVVCFDVRHGRESEQRLNIADGAGTDVILADMPGGFPLGDS